MNHSAKTSLRRGQMHLDAAQNLAPGSGMEQTAEAILFCEPEPEAQPPAQLDRLSHKDNEAAHGKCS